MIRPPSFEEAVGGSAEQFPEIVAQRLTQMGVDLRGSQARMPEQELNDADVHALLEHVRGKAVPKRVRPKPCVEAALAARLMERESRGGIGKMGDESSTGKQPPIALVDLPDLAKHLKNRFRQRKGPLFVPLADHAQYHLLRVDRRDGQRDGLGDSQAVGVDQREAAAIDRLLKPPDQTAAILVATDVGQPLLARLANFFLVSSGQS